MVTSKDGPGSLTPLPSPPQAGRDGQAGAQIDVDSTGESQLATPSSIRISRGTAEGDMDSDHLDSDENMEDGENVGAQGGGGEDEVEEGEGEGEDDKVSVMPDRDRPAVRSSTRSTRGSYAIPSFASLSEGKSKARGGRTGGAGGGGGGGGPARGKKEGGGEKNNEGVTSTGEKVLDRDYPKITFDPFAESDRPLEQPIIA